MSLLTTSAASLHQVAAAAALAGPPRRLSIAGIASEQEQGRAMARWWRWYTAIANVLLSAGWLVEQHTLRSQRHLDRATNNAVRVKDICVAGAMFTAIAGITVDQIKKRTSPEDTRAMVVGKRAPEGHAWTGRSWRFFNALPLLNLVCVAGAIAATPVVNFNILKSYRPGTIYRLFT